MKEFSTFERGKALIETDWFQDIDETMKLKDDGYSYMIYVKEMEYMSLVFSSCKCQGGDAPEGSSEGVSEGSLQEDREVEGEGHLVWQDNKLCEDARKLNLQLMEDSNMVVERMMDEDVRLIHHDQVVICELDIRLSDECVHDIILVDSCLMNVPISGP
ncbi:hypothetical protein V6N13_109795 [Hibiscus sabdariffa]|uniref:Uncharacterized protein n=1 Tax=Hibiscus sabdariffa TaxID=183260 RepID=A0ABR2FQM1_9ROSI